jgi:integrase
MVRTGATFANAAAEYLRYIEHDRERKPSTVRGYRSAITAHLLPAFGELPIADVTSAFTEHWIAGFEGSTRTRNKLLIQLHGILGRAKRTYGLAGNAAGEVEKFQ